jgi:hypothetical protein
MWYLRFDPKSIPSPSHTPRSYRNAKIAQDKNENGNSAFREREFSLSDHERRIMELKDKIEDLLIDLVATNELRYILDPSARFFLDDAQKILDEMYGPGNRKIFPSEYLSDEKRLEQHVKYLELRMINLNKFLAAAFKAYVRGINPTLYKDEENLDEYIKYLTNHPEIRLRELYFDGEDRGTPPPPGLQSFDELLTGLLGEFYANRIYEKSLERSTAYLNKYFGIPEKRAKALVMSVRGMQGVLTGPESLMAFHGMKKDELKQFYFNLSRGDAGRYIESLILASVPSITKDRLENEFRYYRVQPPDIHPDFASALTPKEQEALRTYFQHRDLVDFYQQFALPTELRRALQSWEVYANDPEYLRAIPIVMNIMERYTPPPNQPKPKAPSKPHKP